MSDATIALLKRISPIICTKMKSKDINDEYQKHKNKNFKDYAHNMIELNHQKKGTAKSGKVKQSGKE